MIASYQGKAPGVNVERMSTFVFQVTDSALGVVGGGQGILELDNFRAKLELHISTIGLI